MRDIRIITLHKQHYMNDYKELLQCQYSCWGYYDGLDIMKVESPQEPLIEKKSEAPISETWYGLSASVDILQGKSSCQNIGIFRASKDEKRAEQFWKVHDEMPVVGVVFLQLRDKNQYDEIGKNLETINDKMCEELTSQKCEILTYYTFDNADIVLLLHGNSITKLEEIAVKIGALPEIAYSNTVLGISEKYLEKYKKGVLSEEDDILLLNEEIDKIELNIVTSGEVNVPAKIKSLLNVPKTTGISLSQTSVHENLRIEIPETDVDTLVKLLEPKGFATHQNPLYGQDIYNISTAVFCQKKNNWDSIVGIPHEREDNVSESWFRNRIKEYREDMHYFRDNKDLSLYSYYQAFIRTLNLLVQFERFHLSKDIFYLIFPAFHLFDKQMEKIELQEKKDPQEIEDIKNSICSFTDSVNSLIYHIIHTDQMFLMVPGYSGTSFSIPIKMCLLYAWFVDKVISVLNDIPNHKYRCLLVPVMESRPQTSIVRLGLPHGDRLIKIFLSQRTLYMPRNLMIILSHEVAHYVGDEIRERKLRMDCLIKTLAFTLSEAIMPNREILKAGNFSNDFIDIKKQMQVYIMKELTAELEGNKSETKYHASNIREQLIVASEKILLDEKFGVYKDIYRITPGMMVILGKDSDNYLRNMQFINSLQDTFDENRKEILAYETIRNLVDKLLKVYSEVFSDIVAMVFLNSDTKCFEEAFWVSDGKKLDKYEESDELYVRKGIINYLLRGVQMEGVPTESRSFVQRVKNCERVERELFAYNSTLDMLTKYAEKCRENIVGRVLKGENAKKIEEIRNMFQVFNGKSNYDCTDIYQMIQEKIFKYKDGVKALYQDALKEDSKKKTLLK